MIFFIGMIILIGSGILFSYFDGIDERCRWDFLSGICWFFAFWFLFCWLVAIQIIV